MRIIVNSGNRTQAQKAIDEIKAALQRGDAFVVEFSKPKTIHTTNQSNFYWQALKEYGRELGYNAKESEILIHNELKCRLFGIEKEIKYRGSYYPVPKGSTKKISINEYSDLIEELIRLAAEDGYIIPPPR